MSEIRATYSGLISLVIGLLSIITGLAFTIIVTRTLSTEDFGTWGLINGLIIYALMIEPIISYWTIRETARGIPSGKTSVLSSGLLSIVGMFVFILLAYLVGTNSNVDNNILFFAVILVPVMFVNNTLTTINLGSKPQVASYGTLVLGISKIPLTFIFLYYFNLDILGVIIAVVISFLISIAVQIIFAKEKIMNQFNFKFLKQWLKLFWIPLYPGIYSMVLRLDILSFIIITGSVTGIAFWSATIAITSMISYSGLITTATYPKLLKDDHRGYLQENVSQLFYFAIPVTSIAIIFARPALFVLNPVYEEAFFLVIFFSIQTFLGTISRVFQSFLIGIEKVDLDEKSTFKNYLKSKLFFVPSIILIQYTSYVILLAIGLLLLVSINASQLDLLIYWSVLALLIEIPFLLYLYLLTKRNLSISLEYVRILKYLMTSIIIFGLTYILIENFFNYNENIFVMIPNLILFLTFSITLYFGITYLIDTKIRHLFKSIINELKNKIL